MKEVNFYNKLNKLNLIAHRLGFMMTNYPENSLEVLKTIFKNKKMLDACSGFEFDICFTKDSIPVVIHDKYIDDISDSLGLISSYSLAELKKMNFGFRKSLENDSTFKFKIVTLEEILEFFSSNYKLLKDKIIKIESKNFTLFNMHNMEVLSDTINKYPNLTNNIIHLSFYPNNLIALKHMQKKKKYCITKSDLLCDYKIMVMLSKIVKSIDLVSLRIKTNDFPKTNNKNSIRVNKKIFFDTLFMKFSNAIDEKTLKYAIEKSGVVGIYVLNGEKEIKEFCKKVSDDFFEKYSNKFFFTTDNPLALNKNR